MHKVVVFHIDISIILYIDFWTQYSFYKKKEPWFIFFFFFCFKPTFQEGVLLAEKKKNILLFSFQPGKFKHWKAKRKKFKL